MAMRGKARRHCKARTDFDVQSMEASCCASMESLTRATGPPCAIVAKIAVVSGREACRRGHDHWQCGTIRQLRASHAEMHARQSLCDPAMAYQNDWVCVELRRHAKVTLELVTPPLCPAGLVNALDFSAEVRAC